MRIRKMMTLALLCAVLSSCGSSKVSCSDEYSRSALESAIRKSLEIIAIENSTDEEGNQLISSSSIRASIGKIKLVIDDIRTTKEDPDSTKKFCTGSLKIVFSPETFDDANQARTLAGLTSIDEMAESADIEKGVDYLKGEIDYNVQATDDGKKVFAEFENADDKMAVFGEVIAASLLKPMWETHNREVEEQAAIAEKQEQEALGSVRKANLEAAVAESKAADDVINTIWRSLDGNTKTKLLGQQRAWIKQKEASCKIEGIQAATDPNERKAAELNCQARYTQQRVQVLQGSLVYDQTYDEYAD